MIPQYGYLSLHEGITGNPPPVMGHSGYFLLGKDAKEATLFHIATLTRFKVKLKRLYTLKTGGPYEWDFDAAWKPMAINVPQTKERLKFWRDSNRANEIPFPETVVADLLKELNALPPGTRAYHTGSGLAETTRAMLKEQRAAMTKAPPVSSAPQEEERLAVAAPPRTKRPDREQKPREPRAANENVPTGTKKMGVIDHIAAMLTTEWQTTESIVKRLVAIFPDREERAMAVTVRAQCTSQLAVKRGLPVEWDRKAKAARLSPAAKEAA